MAQEAVATVTICIPTQRGLLHRTIWPILQSSYPSGGGESCIHGSTMRQAYVSLSISKYCYSFCVYIIYFTKFFLILLYLWYTVCILYPFLSPRLSLFPFCVYCHSRSSYSRLYGSFHILFWSSNYCFLLNVYYYFKFIFCLISITILKYKYICKISHDSFTIVRPIFWIIQWISLFDHHICL